MEKINPVWELFKNFRDVFKRDAIGIEIAQIALPAAMALAADPIASLIDTAFIGHIGPTELAAVGVAIALFNQASKIAIFPLVSITTSFVAEEDATRNSSSNVEEMETIESGLASNNEKEDLIPKLESTKDMQHNHSHEKVANEKQSSRHNSSASSAIIIGGLLGIVQAVLLIFAAKPLIIYMGIDSGSVMLKPAVKYLTVRSLGAPAVLLSLAMQGVFRGFKDTKTPLYATIIGDTANIILDPIFIFVLRYGVTGAAIAHVISQYLISLILLCKLMVHVDLLPKSINDLQFGRFAKNGVHLLMRVIAATFCVTLAASRAARQGSSAMAAFQICLQVWLASSLLADGLAVSGQAILASAFAKKEFERATTTAARVLQLGLVLGVGLSLLVFGILGYGSAVFTADKDVLKLLRLGIPFVVGTQPINSLAFVFDGINYGASDFAYSGYSMTFVAAMSIISMVLLSASHGFVGIWIALSIFMTLRALAGFWRIGTRTGPWSYLQG